jgi:hypothetical protein
MAISGNIVDPEVGTITQLSELTYGRAYVYVPRSDRPICTSFRRFMGE